MHSEQWEVVFETSGPFQAEMLRGVLEAQDIPVVLSQEGAGKVYGITVGPLGRVQILVPGHDVERAQQILADFESGKLRDMQFLEEGELDFPDEGGEFDKD
jgi:hypothetical protein